MGRGRSDRAGRFRRAAESRRAARRSCRGRRASARTQGGARFVWRVRAARRRLSRGARPLVVVRRRAQAGIAPAPMTRGVAARLGTYALVAARGRCGMGQVYRATETRPGRDVAVQVSREDSDLSEKLLSPFAIEAKASASLSHPNSLALHDIGKDKGVV